MGGLVGRHTHGWVSEHGYTWLPFPCILCFLHVSSVGRSYQRHGSGLGKQKAHQGPITITLLLVSCQPEDFIRTSNKEDEILSFTKSILLQEMRQNINYLGEESRFIQPGNMMAGVCWEGQGERDECGCELFMVTIGTKKPAHQLILTNTTKKWQLPQRPVSDLSSCHVNWKLELVLEEVKSLHFHDSAHGIQNPRQFGGLRKRPWPLAIPFSGTLGHSVRGWLRPHGVQEGPVCGDMMKACPTAPCTGAHSASHRHSAAETRLETAETGPACLTICPLPDTSGTEAGTFLPLSFLLFFPLFPPVPLSSSTQTLITLTSCALDMGNVAGTFSMASPSVQPCVCYFP